MHRFTVFLLAGILLLCGICHATAAENQKTAQPGQRNSSAAKQTNRPTVPCTVAHSERPIAVVFTVRIIQNGKKPLAEPQIRMRLPLACPQQDIDRLDVEGQPRRELDRWKEPVAAYRQSTLSPNEILTARWSADCRIRELQWNLRGLSKKGTGAEPSSENAAKAGHRELPVPLLQQAASGPRDTRIPALSDDEKALYLRDAEKFALNDPVVKAAAKEATAGRPDVVAKLEGIYDFVMNRLKYSRDGRWEPAPAVLASGKGSCSEFTYVFVALCRASGIPARYAGGLTARPDTPLHVDLVNHRFAQAFIDGLGWVDFDPTRNGRLKDRRFYFGRTSRQMLLLCAGDGGPGSLTDWEYCSLQLWNGKGVVEDDDSQKAPNYAPTAIVQIGWWMPQPSTQVRNKVAAFRKRLTETPPAQRRPLIDEALAINHPYVLPWLDDLLYDRSTRVAAARAFLKIGGKEAFPAVVDNLCRQRDAEGDRQIGDLLNAFTGQHFGPDRKKWKNWIKANPPPSPIPGQTGT